MDEVDVLALDLARASPGVRWVRGFGARGYHYRLLATLAEFGPASQAELGRRSGIHVSDMVATINDLADNDLVERDPIPTTGAATSSP
ncbi:MarR family transcriptional regulator [Nocardia sp. NPDC051833]|uniref:MarR family transcriptional regulator n=1 Tax=Nocardia sp. NPDC051833 TaxID=3155674 RepID=UPI00343F75D4